MSIVNVVATIVTKPEQADKVESHLRGLIAPSRLDAGCLSYDLHRDADAQNIFVFYETWESRAMLDAHLETPHLLAWRSKAPELIQSMDVKVLTKLS